MSSPRSPQDNITEQKSPRPTSQGQDNGEDVLPPPPHFSSPRIIGLKIMRQFINLHRENMTSQE
jgi:hypothetical protein